ncbi:30S ribosomal protein S20 [Leptospira borgpetersenii]|uniref:Small ribosomal subunit protein bS20 n=1 Tax=Leptospira borgpetersenii serovar Javanica str. UI 09931 TaxID=1049767 RepID=A0AAV3J9Y5_LEPBO|nr:30S ribosomal protein S20 [Leptospira borgpetersenii]AXX14524.1 30S ribosomal protein S20 [Leptospira borgpetersenii serovar Ceylonica]EKQ92042.1 ribosomal protein S20 [Leptospira borgpetersenii str. UI 09149]EMN59471.1 ribosomal protein S20 [Leptospira borgpetersenii serovar Javanica str. MK146]EPG57356.1 ribosomal protein S20 [Leptospira borgpetersenii serovar Javanica str. UI 09931]MDQ7243540.1 30S ribosomal protein S20 [Leptospira borgpetersenii]
MANIKSSEKDIRRTKRRNAANSQNRSRLRTQAKKILKAIKEKDPNAAMALFVEYTSFLDKAAKTNLIHSKNADRKKSRMAKRLNAVSAAA